MAKQINVNLAFNADVSQAKAQIQDLQNSLNSISTAGLKNGTGATMAEDLKKASAAALDLQIHLKNAVNQDTGKLDFAYFNESIKKSGNSLNAYADTLRKLGPQGEEAFIKLARAVSNSEIPLMRSNTLLNNIWIAMKNTARWQLSSSVLHAFMGTMSSAYNYAKDLNSSLNNIRIVTGYSTDQMAKFAKEANKSAKALNATTTEYTNASLIYYQQGLSDDEVKKRTDVTIKMANVSRESAQVVSDQMTAVWNNFAKGGENLEYYADVMTALGAATASSTAEISAGLEKFAAIAETVGLSYEYSTAALATITATTRQSADVVGNALKTLFARIQGLSLGETLEDGVDLNKYSTALKTVGVDVLTANGELREMDDILDDLGAKWDTIGKAEQTALAQTVAGVRQYTQLVALMDNWDFMKENLDVAYNSTGALQEQADIYAESWEAAGDRVRAAAENIFDSILEDKFFIGMLNNIESVLSAIGKLVDSLGGMHGVIAALGVVFTKVFSTQMQTGLENLAYTLKMSTPSGMQSIVNEKLEFFNTQRTDLYGSDSEQSKILASESQLQKQFITAQLNKTLSPYQTELIQAKMNQYTSFNDERIAALNNKDIAQMNLANAKGDLFAKLQKSGKGISPTEQINNLNSIIDGWITAREGLKNASDSDMALYGEKTQALENAARELAKNKDGKDIVGKKQIEDYVKQRMAFNQQDKKVTALNTQGGTMQEDLNKILNGANQGMISWSATAVSAARATGQLAMGINSLKAAFTAIKDPDASGWEKFSSVVMSLSFAIPALINGWQGLKGVIALLNAETIALGLNSAAQWVNAKSRMGGTAGLFTGSKGDIKKQAAIEAERRNAARVANWDKGRKYQVNGESYEVKKGNLQKGGVLAPSYIVNAKGHKVNNSEIQKQVWKQRDQDLKNANLPKDTANTVIAGNALNSIGSILTKIGPYAAAIGGVAVAINLASKAWHAHETAATNAAKKVEEATENYQNTVSKLNSFKQSVESFENAKKNLAELTRGTEAYSDGIKKANEEAKKLIETYNLYGQFTYDSGGLIKFNKGVLDNIEAQKEQAVLSAENLKYFAEYDLSEANLQRQKVNLNRKMNLTNQETGYSASIEDVVDALQDWKESKTEDSFVDYLVSTGNQLAQFGNEITPNLSALESLADSVISAADAADYFTKSILQNKIKEQYGDQIDAIADSNEEADLITSAVAENIMAQNENILKDYGSNTGNVTVDAWNDGITKATRFNADMGILNDEDLARQYAMKILGKTEAELANMIYKGGIGKGSFTDLGGNTIIAEISDAEMREQLARQKYLDENISTENTEEEIDRLDQIKTSMKSSDYDIWSTILSALASKGKNIDFALEDYASINKEEYNKLQKLTNEELATDLNVEELIGEGKKWTSAEEFAKEFWDAYYNNGNGQEEWQKEKFREGADSLGNQKAQEYGLDLEEFKAYRDLLYEQNTELAKTPELLNEVAIAHSRLYQGQEKLNKISNDYGNILMKAAKQIKGKGMSVLDEKTLKQLETSIPEIKDGISDLYDVSGDTVKTLTNKDIIENWETLEKAIDGDKDAYNEFQKVLIKNNIKDAMGLESIEDIPDSISTMIDDIANIEGVNVGDKIGLDTDIGQKINTVASEAANAVYAATGDVAQATAAYNAALSAMGMVETGKLVAETYTVTQETPAGFTPAENGSYTDAQGNTYTGVKFIPGAPNVIQHQMTRLVPEGGEGFTVKETDLGGSSGGGGGGGGGAKAPEKPKEYDKERYYTIKRQIENLGREYDQLSEKTNRAFGKDKLDLMDQQIAKIDERIAAQKELIAETEAYLALDKENMVKSYNELFGGKGPQFEFDENGVITNFDEIQDYIYENYLVAGDEANKETSDAQKAWLDNYGETLQENAEAVQGLIDLEYEKIDTQLAKIEYEIELRVELSEDDLEYLEYLLGKIEDDAFKAAEAIANMGEQMNSLYEQAAANEKGIHDILANRGVSDEDISKFIAGDISVVENIDFSEAEIEQLRNYRDGLLENAEAMEELRKSIEEKLMEVFDAWTEKLDQGIERVEFFGSVLESYGNIIDIVGKKTLGITDDFMNNLGEAVVKNAIDNMEALKAEEKAINETLQAAQNELEKARATGDERLIKYWEDQVTNLTAEAQEAHEAFLSSWEEALDQATAVFEAAVEAAIEQFNEAIYSLGGLEGLAADFEKQQELADMYLEDYKKIYELSKLNRDINKSIDDTDNLAAKRKLRDLQEEINALEEAGVEMSEYDLEYLQAKYELRLAEIALEEAQNAKDTVRLQKDNEGNYSYVYTANTDAVDEAQQKYEDALYEMQDLSSNYVDEMSSQIIDATQQMMEELSAIRRADYDSEEEYQEAYARTEAYWLERIGRMNDELNKSINNNKELYDEDWTNYHNATGYKISDTDKFVTNFADSMYGALMGVDSTADLMDIIANATSKLIEDLITTNNTFVQNQEEIFNAAETSINDFANDAAGSIEKIGEASKQTTEDIKNMSEEMKTDIDDIINTIAQFQEEVFPVMDEFISKWETAVAVVNELITAVADLGDLTGNNVNVSNSSGNNITSTSGNSNTGYTGDWSDNTTAHAYQQEQIAKIDEQIAAQKELVAETEAYLDGDIMNTILALIDLNARQASMAFGTLTPSGLYDETRTTLQQEVSIVAEFPNVQDRNEIAEALNNLINSASQYANRKL